MPLPPDFAEVLQLRRNAHLLARVRNGPRRAIELMFEAGTDIHPGTRTLVDRALDLMDRYANVPMDFVDALMVSRVDEDSFAAFGAGAAASFVIDVPVHDSGG